MSVEDPKTGREVFYYFCPGDTVPYGYKLRCGNAFYLNKSQTIRWFAGLARLEVIK